MALTTAEKNKLQHAIDLMVKGNAPQLPFDATIIQEVAAVAQSSGYQVAATFTENAKNSPISTLLAFVKFIGA